MSDQEILFYDHIDSPVGLLEFTASSTGLQKLHLQKVPLHPISPNEITDETKSQLINYFNKKSFSFQLPFDFGEAPGFSVAVWNILSLIPYGTTRTYGEIAEQLGNINKSRAVGLANGSNPIAIIIPCHRVIGSDGSLTGYAYGLEVKEYLLRHENPSRFVKQGLLF